MWDAYKIPIVIVGVILLVLVVIILARRSATAHAEKTEAFAKSKGWKYSRWDDRRLVELLESIYPDQRYFVHDICEVRSKDPMILLFDCRRRDPANAKLDISSTACLVQFSQSASGRPAVFIDPMNYADKLVVSNEIDLQYPEFAKEFIVTGSDPLSAARVITKELMHLLLENRKRDGAVPLNIIIGAGHLLVLTGTMDSLEDEAELSRFVEVSRNIAATIESHERAR